MVQINDQVAALSKTQLDAAIKGAEVAVETLGKLTELQLETARTAYADGSQALRQLAAAKDPAQLSTLLSGQQAWDRTATYARSVYDIVSTAQAEIATVLEQHMAEFNKSVVVAVDAAAKSAPPGSETAISALKSAIHTGNTWYETAVKAARQAASATEASFANATAPVASARRKAA